MNALDRFSCAALVAMCGFGVVAYIVLLVGASVPDWLLPVAGVFGCGVACFRPAVATSQEPIAWPWLLAAMALLGTSVVAVAWGSLATPSRHWDGAVAWDVHASVLAAAPTLKQPFFAAGEVFNHSRDYPLLQPLLIAFGDRYFGVGRALFPVLYLLILVVGGCAMRHRCGQRLALAGTVALGLTPFLVSPGSGGADSGYADMLLLLATTTVAAGLLRRDGLLLSLGACLAVMSKPEGLAYGVLPALIVAVAGDRMAFRASCMGWLVGAIAWLPLHVYLASSSVPAGLMIAVFAFLLVAMWGVDRLLLRDLRVRTRGLLLLMGFVLCAVLAGVVLYAAGNHGTLGAYLGEPGRLLQRLPRLPAVLLGMLEYGLLKKFGLTFAIPLVLIVARLCKQIGPPPMVLGAWLGLGLCTIMLPFFLSPETDLEHHLKSSMERLLLHWIGPAWLVVIAWLSTSRPGSEPQGGVG